METSCFQPDSAAVFSRRLLSCSLKSVLCLKAKSLSCFLGLSGRGVVNFGLGRLFSLADAACGMVGDPLGKGLGEARKKTKQDPRV
ncbi:hypothetical protein [Desulfitobacterium dehalogenans]|uniref:hypothetical protein n=1 Tax=Desulfitobacterium dehalogenans TaxID=36854 RepID=UPI001305395A|nr:hypothetical protein [Desulfitobacterium dehalogenans]